MQNAWAAAHEGFTPEELATVQFAEDALAFLEWQDQNYSDEELPTRKEAEVTIEEGTVELAGNLSFFFDEKRFATKVDRDMLKAVARALRTRPRVGQDPAALLEGFLERHSDSDMREWMALAGSDPGKPLTRSIPRRCSGALFSLPERSCGQHSSMCD